MLKHLLAAAALALTATIATPAGATPLVGAGVDSCQVNTIDPGGRAYCQFVSTGGSYVLEIYSSARYAWAQVTCVPQGGHIFVDVWNTEGGYDREFGVLPSGVCTMEVASDRGTATGYLHR